MGTEETSPLGFEDGDAVGDSVGFKDGLFVENRVGFSDGKSVGESVDGDCVGLSVELPGFGSTVDTELTMEHRRC